MDENKNELRIMDHYMGGVELVTTVTDNALRLLFVFKFRYIPLFK